MCEFCPTTFLPYATFNCPTFPSNFLKKIKKKKLSTLNEKPKNLLLTNNSTQLEKKNEAVKALL